MTLEGVISIIAVLCGLMLLFGRLLWREYRRRWWPAVRPREDAF